MDVQIQLFLTSVLGGSDWSAMSLSLYSRGKSSPASDWIELGWAICRRQDNSERSLAAQEAGGEYITARTSTGLKTGPQRLTVAIMDRIGPTRMAKARTPKDFFVVARFIALFWLELVAPQCLLIISHCSPRALHLVAEVGGPSDRRSKAASCQSIM